MTAWRALPRIVRLIVANAFAGAVLGALVGAAMLALNILNLYSLLATGADAWIGSMLFMSGMMSTFGSLYAAGAIMLDKGD